MIKSINIEFESFFDKTGWILDARFGAHERDGWKVSLIIAPNGEKKSTLLGLTARKLIQWNSWHKTRSRDIPGIFEEGAKLDIDIDTDTDTDIDTDTDVELDSSTPPADRGCKRLIAISGTSFDRFPSPRNYGSPSRRGEDAPEYYYFGPKIGSNLVGRGQSIEQIGDLMLASDIAHLARALALSGLPEAMNLSGIHAMNFRVRPGTKQTASIQSDFQSLERLAEAYLGNKNDLVEPAKSGQRYEDSDDLAGVAQQVMGKTVDPDVIAAFLEKIRSVSAELDEFGWSNLRRFETYRPSRPQYVSMRFDVPFKGAPIGDEPAKRPQEIVPRSYFSRDAIVLLRAMKYLVLANVEFVNQRGRLVDTEILSSGEFHLLTSIVGATLSVCDDCILLVDEPENSLHPLWQAQYLDLLSNVIGQHKNAHAIVATHSALLASSLVPGHGEVLSAHRREVEGRPGIHFKAGQDDTLGRSVDDLLVNFFGLPLSRNYFFAMKLQEAVDLYAENAVDTERYHALCDELSAAHRSLKADDPLQDVLSELFHARRRNYGEV